MIRKGAEEVCHNVSVLLDSGNTVVCDLTGGRDSRLLLAALVALGRVGEVVFNTADRGKDVDIASGLVKKYGGSYKDERSAPVDYYTRTIDDVLMKRRSQILGTYHLILQSQVSTVTAIAPERRIRMLGGSGELYRDYYQKFFRSADPQAPYSAEYLLRVLADERDRFNGFRKGMWPDQFEVFKLDLIETFEVLPGNTIGQKLDSHYFHFRNRYHFGVIMTNPVDSHGLNPVLAPSVLRAARGLPQAEKATGRAMFDLTRAMCEELAYTVYDKPSEFDFTQSAYHKPGRLDGQQIDVSPAREIVSKGEAAHPKVKRPHAEPVDLHAVCHQQALECLEVLGSTDGPFTFLATEKFVDHLASLRANAPTRLATWYSRLQSYVDYQDLLS